MSPSLFLVMKSSRMMIKMMMMMMMCVVVFMIKSATANGYNINSLVEMSSREELVNIAGYGEDKLSTVAVSGKVLCHACMGGIFPVPTHPISGASVAVFCGSHGKSKKSWARGTTGEYGDFYIDLPSHLHAIPNIESVCFVKVLQLPRSSLCRPAFTGKHQGLKLMSIEEGARFYAAPDILLMPKHFQAPKTRATN